MQRNNHEKNKSKSKSKSKNTTTSSNQTAITDGQKLIVKFAESDPMLIISDYVNILNLLHALCHVENYNGIYYSLIDSKRSLIGAINKNYKEAESSLQLSMDSLIKNVNSSEYQAYKKVIFNNLNAAAKLTIFHTFEKINSPFFVNFFNIFIINAELEAQYEQELVDFWSNLNNSIDLLKILNKIYFDVIGSNEILKKEYDISQNKFIEACVQIIFKDIVRATMVRSAKEDGKIEEYKHEETKIYLYIISHCKTILETIDHVSLANLSHHELQLAVKILTLLSAILIQKSKAPLGYSNKTIEKLKEISTKTLEKLIKHILPTLTQYQDPSIFYYLKIIWMNTLTFGIIGNETTLINYNDIYDSVKSFLQTHPEEKVKTFPNTLIVINGLMALCGEYFKYIAAADDNNGVKIARSIHPKGRYLGRMNSFNNISRSEVSKFILGSPYQNTLTKLNEILDSILPCIHFLKNNSDKFFGTLAVTLNTNNLELMLKWLFDSTMLKPKALDKNNRVELEKWKQIVNDLKKIYQGLADILTFFSIHYELLYRRELAVTDLKRFLNININPELKLIEVELNEIAAIEADQFKESKKREEEATRVENELIKQENQFESIKNAIRKVRQTQKENRRKFLKELRNQQSQVNQNEEIETITLPGQLDEPEDQIHVQALGLIQTAHLHIRYGRLLSAKACYQALSSLSKDYELQALDGKIICQNKILGKIIDRHLLIMRAKLNTFHVLYDRNIRFHIRKMNYIQRQYQKNLMLCDQFETKLAKHADLDRYTNLAMMQSYKHKLSEKINQLKLIDDEFKEKVQQRPTTQVHLTATLSQFTTPAFSSVSSTLLHPTGASSTATPASSSSLSSPTPFNIDDHQDFPPLNSPDYTHQMNFKMQSNIEPDIEIPKFSNLNELFEFLKSNTELTDHEKLEIKKQILKLLHNKPNPDDVREFLLEFFDSSDLMTRYQLLIDIELFPSLFGLQEIAYFNPNQFQIMAELEKIKINMGLMDASELNYDLMLTKILSIILMNSFSKNILIQSISDWYDLNSPIQKIIQHFNLSQHAQSILHVLLTTELVMKFTFQPDLSNMPKSIQALQIKIFNHNKLIIENGSVDKEPYYLHIYGSSAVAKVTTINHPPSDIDYCTNIPATEFPFVHQKLLNLIDMDVFHRIYGPDNKIDYSTSVQVHRGPLTEAAIKKDIKAHQLSIDCFTGLPIYWTLDAKTSINRRELKSILPIKNYLSDPQKFLRLVISHANYGFNLNPEDQKELDIVITDLFSKHSSNVFLSSLFNPNRLQTFLFKFAHGRSESYFTSANVLKLIGFLLPIPLACLPLSSFTVLAIKNRLIVLDSEHASKRVSADKPYSNDCSQLATILATILFQSIVNAEKFSELYQDILQELPKRFVNAKLIEEITLNLNILKEAPKYAHVQDKSRLPATANESSQLFNTVKIQRGRSQSLNSFFDPTTRRFHDTMAKCYGRVEENKQFKRN